MFTTEYFKNISLPTISTNLASLKSGIESAKKQNTSVISLFDACEWVGESKSNLDNALKDLGTKLNELGVRVDNFIKVVSIAKEITDIQTRMKSNTDYTSLTADANTIQEKLKTIQNSYTATYDNVFDNVIQKGIIMTPNGALSYPFSVNTGKFIVAKDSFYDFSRLLKTNYDSFLSLKATVSSDSLLYNVWGTVCSIFDRIMKKCDNINSWSESFAIGIDDIEVALPEKVVAPKFFTVPAFAQTHENPGTFDINTYIKNGQVSEIKNNPPSNDTGGSSGGSTTGGGYYGGGGGGGYSGGGGTGDGGTGGTDGGYNHNNGSTGGGYNHNNGSTGGGSGSGGNNNHRPSNSSGSGGYNHNNGSSGSGSSSGSHSRSNSSGAKSVTKPKSYNTNNR